MKSPHLYYSGFTIIELMLTIAVLATITAFAVPNFNQLVQRQSVRTQANSLQNALNFARNESLTRNSTIDACWNFESTEWAFPNSTDIEDPISNNAIAIAPNTIAIAVDSNPDELINSTDLGTRSNLTLTTSDDTTQGCVAFTPQGFLVGGAANSVTFSVANFDDTEKLEAELSVTGRTVVSKPDSTTTTEPSS